MRQHDTILTLTTGHLRWLLLILAAITVVIWGAPALQAQKVQEEYRDAFKIATEDGGIAIAASADGQYVYLVGKKGLVVSNDHGKTGSWVQTLRLK